MATTSYRDAGVDVDAGDQFVDWIQSSEGASPHQQSVVSGVGGFAALFRAPWERYRKPLLVSSTDGVGTKVKIAADANRLETIGQDLVAMCVNDLVTTGADPLFFLDYYATGRLDLPSAKQFLSGVRRACHASNCALIGGETAEMPGLYTPPDFDCAGFAVGIVDELAIWSPARAQTGDAVVGASSSGFHSNGYSLLRRLFASDLEEWLDILLKPTHLYAKLVGEVRVDPDLIQGVRSCAHITGGGAENLPRAVGKGQVIRLKRWPWPEEFLEVQRRSHLSSREMLRTLNCGVGFAFVVEPNLEAKLSKVIERCGFESIPLGVVKGSESGESTAPSLDDSVWS